MRSSVRDKPDHVFVATDVLGVKYEMIAGRSIVLGLNRLCLP